MDSREIVAKKLYDESYESVDEKWFPWDQLCNKDKQAWMFAANAYEQAKQDADDWEWAYSKSTTYPIIISQSSGSFIAESSDEDRGCPSGMGNTKIEAIRALRAKLNG